MVRKLKSVWVLTLCASMLSCAGPSGDSLPHGPVSFSLDSLRSGDLVCRLGDGFFSNIFRRYSGGEERFSHIGVVHREDSLLFVVHAEASELTGVGSVRMDPLPDFLDHAIDYAFYLVQNDTVRERIDSVVVDYCHRETRFDVGFDSSSDSTLYCTELVAVAINKAMSDSSYITTYPLRDNFSYYRIDDILRCAILKR